MMKTKLNSQGMASDRQAFQSRRTGTGKNSNVTRIKPDVVGHKTQNRRKLCELFHSVHMEKAEGLCRMNGKVQYCVGVNCILVKQKILWFLTLHWKQTLILMLFSLFSKDCVLTSSMLGRGEGCAPALTLFHTPECFSQCLLHLFVDHSLCLCKHLDGSFSGEEELLIKMSSNW